MGVISNGLPGLLQLLEAVGAQQTPDYFRSDVGILPTLDVGRFAEREGLEVIIDEQQVDTSPGAGTYTAKVYLNPLDVIVAVFASSPSANMLSVAVELHYGEGGSAEPVIVELAGASLLDIAGYWSFSSGTRRNLLPMRFPAQITATGLIPRVIAPKDGQVVVYNNATSSAAGPVVTFKTLIVRPRQEPGAIPEFMPVDNK